MTGMESKKVLSLANTLKHILENYGIPVDNIAIFGSVMRGSDNSDSDLDMIVISKAFENKSIFQRADMLYKPETEFIKAIKLPVDILTYTTQEYLESISNKLIESRIIL